MTDDPTDPAPAPDLRKAEPAAAPSAPTPAAAGEPAAPPASIWQPLDGSAPKPPTPAQTPWAATFTTPEGVATGPAGGASGRATLPGGYGDRPVFVLAGWGRRAGALIIDNILIGIAVLVVSVPIGVALGMTVNEAMLFFSYNGDVPDSIASPAPFYAVLAIQFFIQSTLPALFLAKWNGQTPGKRSLGLRVVRESGAPMDLTTALRRELLARGIILPILTLLTLTIALFGNYLWPLWDNQNRTGHDRFAKTRVVREQE